MLAAEGKDRRRVDVKEHDVRRFGEVVCPHQVPLDDKERIFLQCLVDDGCESILAKRHVGHVDKKSPRLCHIIADDVEPRKACHREQVAADPRSEQRILG
eukprot:1824917-Prymnesium_polylepis.3